MSWAWSAKLLISMLISRWIASLSDSNGHTWYRMIPMQSMLFDLVSLSLSCWYCCHCCYRSSEIERVNSVPLRRANDAVRMRRVCPVVVNFGRRTDWRRRLMSSILVREPTGRTAKRTSVDDIVNQRFVAKSLCSAPHVLRLHFGHLSARFHYLDTLQHNRDLIRKSYLDITLQTALVHSIPRQNLAD